MGPLGYGSGEEAQARAATTLAGGDDVILRWIELVYGQDLAERVAPFADRLDHTVP